MKLKSKPKINLHINIQITQNINQLLHTEAKEPCYCRSIVLDSCESIIMPGL